ncbi:unnamed protein product [Linum tenue]|uniref:Glycosyltransferase n=1 Tax=Linum tenue TaxID=586396 RepID=A0AAV0RJP7_9ROSI|nr:unnamed protein product [Linum tenue]
MAPPAPEPPLHVMLVCFPGQGHINPFLRLANLLASHGLRVTFTINLSTARKMKSLPSSQCRSQELKLEPNTSSSSHSGAAVHFDFFDDGHDEESIKRVPLDQLMTLLEQTGRKALPEMVRKYADQGSPVSCFVSNPFLPWVSDVAATLDIPCAVLWIQSCASFTTYYHFHNKLVEFPTPEDQERDVVLPGMPVMKHDEIPSFLHPTTPYGFLATAILGQFAHLDNVFCVLMETFERLEEEIIGHVSKFCEVRPVGPLWLGAKASVGPGDLMEADDDCIGWLDRQEPGSVIYVSMGSIVGMSAQQRAEMAHGLMGSGLPFLWVVRPGHEEGEDADLGLPEGLGERGKVVRWAPQEAVLGHVAVSCFVTHCGWNSTLEAIGSGKPVVAFPQWGDQVTDAKFLEEVFRVGVRMGRGDTWTKLVTREEVERCLREVTVGPRAEEMRENAVRWKREAEAAVEEGGSSERNVREFVEEVKKKSVEMTRRKTETTTF